MATQAWTMPPVTHPALLFSYRVPPPATVATAPTSATVRYVHMDPIHPQKPHWIRLLAQCPKACLVVLLVLLAAYRFTLIDRGHFYWGDERCYQPASAFVDAFAAGEWTDAGIEMFDARRDIPAARPGFVLFSVLPVLAQRAINPALGISTDSLSYYDVASGFNVLVTLAVTLCIYALGCVWTKRPWFALLMAFVYSLLCNANIWIRHQMPYPESLLLFLIALWLISSSPTEKGRGRGRILFAGVLSALGYACCPGHYAFVVINGITAMSRSGQRIKCGALYCMGSACVMGMLEALSWTVGRSYFSDLRALSGSITMGDPKEGFVFFWHYLRDVEGIVGALLLALFCWFAVSLLRRDRMPIPPAARAAMIAAIAAYLFHASMGVLFGKMVFYGRVAMIYLPFLVGGATLALVHLDRIALRRIGVAALATASVISFVSFARSYSQVVYPADFLHDTMTQLGRNVTYPPNSLWGYVYGDYEKTVEHVDAELVSVTDSRPDGSEDYVLLASHADAHASDAKYIGVNLKFMWYIRGQYDRFEPPDDFDLVAQALHPEVIPASGYEGRKPWERNRIRNRQYMMRIYQRKSQPARLTSSSGA